MYCNRNAKAACFLADGTRSVPATLRTPQRTVPATLFADTSKAGGRSLSLGSPLIDR